MDQMIKKTLIYITFFVLILVTSLEFTGTTDYRSRLFASWQPCLPGGFASSTLSPIKVYMYDLPRRFNVGMLTHPGGNASSSDVDDNVAVTRENIPPWPARSGLNRQHSVEYWLMASLLYYNDTEEANGSGQEVVRVMDPDSAEAFFVPFFSSLSFNVHGNSMRDPQTEFDKQLQVDIVKFLRESKYWQRSSGRDHIIPVHHPNAFRFLHDDVKSAILIVSDFGRFTHLQANLSKDVVAPYDHVVDSYMNDDLSDPFDSRPTLLYFRGRIHRKDEGKVRGTLARVLNITEGVIFEEGRASGDGVQANDLVECLFLRYANVPISQFFLLFSYYSIRGMHSSKFCLNPAGDTPSSCRLFDAIVSHCVPVIVSDKLELPYEDELDYSEFSVFFSDEEASRPKYLVDKLRGISKEKWLGMWRQLKNISRHFEYQYPPKEDDAVNMIWRQISHKLPAVQLAEHRNRRLKIPDWWR
ncbi:glycosyltransferase [Lithospermum erythrorhizon]|uniref:Glycosyltransferase n=1 Tax=Lithospermum erythrorhizon TaxID=34254 RepID=A0AAV3RK24_LITER